MNVIVANEQQSTLMNLDCDVIKSITGLYNASEIVEMFKNFFYSKMVLDVTALKNYNDISTYQEIKNGLDVDKIIFLLPEGSSLCTSNFLSNLISTGIYNFTTNLEGINYLLKKSNTLKDVEHIQKLSATSDDQSNQGFINNNINNNSNNNNQNVPSNNVGNVNNVQMTVRPNDGSAIIGVKNVTEGAGATTFIYMLKKELNTVYGKNGVVCIEVNKSDFQVFNDPNMVSVNQTELSGTISKYSNAQIILVDLNNSPTDTMCSEVLYLLEPSTLKLNKLFRKNKFAFQRINNKRVILNKSLLTNKDVSDFEHEVGLKVYYNIPPLDERKRNGIISDFLASLGLIGGSNNNGGGKIFGLFRR